MTTAEEKLDSVLKSLEQENADGQKDLRRRLEKLEKDMSSGQEEATQRVVKRLKEDRTLVFKKKGNEKQFLFNDNVKDQIDSAGKHLDLLEPSSEAQTVALQKAKDELEKGLSLLASRQKRIKLADRSEYGWAVVDEYEDDELASDEDDAKRIEKAEKAVAAKAVKWKKATNPRANRQAQGRQQRTWEQPPAQEQRERFPSRVDWSRPSSSTGRPPRVAGQCWHCGEMGHLRAACPKLVKPYPFYDIECVNEPQRECDLSKVKLYEGESADSGSLNVSKAEVPGVSTSMPTDVCGVDATQDELACESEMCTDGESSELMTDLMRTWDYEEPGHQITDVQGRLLANVNFWEQELKAPSIVIEWIKQGYKLPLLSLPDPFERANHKSALENKDFVSGALKDLVNNCCVLEVCSVPRVCSPLSVVTNSSGKKRLVIDLRYLNGYLLKEKFKYEDLRIAMLMFQKGDYMFSFDLKSGYHHVDINEKNWQYLGFAWDNGGGKKYFCFKVLPFGLATACYVFTKLLRPIIKYWRSQSLRAIIYLDDGVVAVKGKDAADAASRRVRNDLSKAGLVENTEKSNWVPAQRLAWLGFIIDLEKGKMEVPMEKLEALLRQLKQAMLLRALPARSIASITGKIISMSIALGPVTRLMTRSLYALISTRYSWCHMLESYNFGPIN